MEKTILVEKNVKGKMFVEKIQLKPEESVEINNENDLFYFIESGYGVMYVEKYGYNFEQETSIFVPKNSAYTFTNTGNVDLVVVYYGVK